jgi:hypothetical protein
MCRDRYLKLAAPKQAARVLTAILTNESGPTGIYFYEGGHPMVRT